MDVTPLITSDQKIMQSYAGGAFKVSGETYAHSIFLAPHHVMEWVHGIPLSVGDFDPLMDILDTIDVVLVGTGAQTVFLQPDVKKALREKGLHVECMDTGAACRTYNVLMAEGRRVMAALVPIS